MNRTDSTGPGPLEKYGLDRPESGDDVHVPFTLENLDCRGRSVRLADTLNQVARAHDYPDGVIRLLGEAMTLAALMGSSLKFAGRFILQTQTDGPVNMMVVDMEMGGETNGGDENGVPGGLRAYARFDQKALAAAKEKQHANSAAMLGRGHLAMTIDQGAHAERYQGIVEIDGSGLEAAAHQYFAQSEQIPTMVRLAVGEHRTRGEAGSNWRAGGMMVQHFPKAGQQPPQKTMETGKETGDMPPEGGKVAADDPDNWMQAQSLFATIGDDELVDPGVSSERLLFRLFHESGVRVFEPGMLEARCTCSAERTEAMLQANFSADERREMARDGEIEVTCEFCSTTYHFNPNQFAMKD